MAGEVMGNRKVVLLGDFFLFLLKILNLGRKKCVCLEETLELVSFHGN